MTRPACRLAVRACPRAVAGKGQSRNGEIRDGADGREARADCRHNGNPGIRRRTARSVHHLVDRLSCKGIIVATHMETRCDVF